MARVIINSQPDERESWRISTQSSVVTNDSDITFIVPANTEWQVHSILLTYVASATVGNRQVALQLLNAADAVIDEYRPSVVQAADATYVYKFGGVPQDLAARDSNYVGVTMPVLFLTAGQKLRIYDNKAIAAATDDLTIYMQIASRSIA